MRLLGNRKEKTQKVWKDGKERRFERARKVSGVKHGRGAEWERGNVGT